MQLHTPVGDVYSSMIMTCVHGYDVIGVSWDMDRLSLLQLIGVSCGVLCVRLEFREVVI